MMDRAGGGYRDYSVASYMSSCSYRVAKEDTRVLELNKYTYLCLNIENLRQWGEREGGTPTFLKLQEGLQLNNLMKECHMIESLILGSFQVPERKSVIEGFVSGRKSPARLLYPRHMPKVFVVTLFVCVCSCECKCSCKCVCECRCVCFEERGQPWLLFFRCYLLWWGLSLVWSWSSSLPWLARKP